MKKSILILLLLPLLTSGQVTQIGQDIDGVADDNSSLGMEISANGSIIIVGAPGNSEGGIGAGSARIFENISGTWTQVGQSINGEQEGENSGLDVATSADGSIIAIGSPGYDSIGEDNGRTRVFENQNGTWVQIGEDIVGIAAGDASGFSVDISDDGSIVGIGAITSAAGGNFSGQIQIFQNQNGVWQQMGQNINGVADEFAGRVELAPSGTRLAIGAPATENFKGSVTVYDFNDASNVWEQVGETILGQEEAENIGADGMNFSANGNILAIGAPIAPILNAPGLARVYQLDDNSGNWTQLGSDIMGEFDFGQLGRSIALSPDGNAIAIGANGAGFGDITDGDVQRGVVTLYEFQTDDWVQVGDEIKGEAPEDQFGFTLSLSDNGVLAVGAYLNDGGGVSSGHVRAFNINSLVSVEETSDTMPIMTVFPNPASDMINIQIENGLPIQGINIFNSMGQQVLTSQNPTFNISDLDIGIYMIEVLTQQGKITQKVVLR